MMLFVTVILVQIVALATPGPDFFFISQTAVSRSRKEALRGVLGITLGVAIWAGLALMGLHLLLIKMAWLQRVITLGGGLYLSWMGWRMLQAACAKGGQQQNNPESVTENTVVSSNAFLRGLLTNLANPKVIIYFGSVFSLFVGDNVSSGERIGLFFVIIAETLLWFCLVASLFALPAMRRGYQRMAKWIDGCAGVLFIGFGMHLIFSRPS